RGGIRSLHARGDHGAPRAQLGRARGQARRRPRPLAHRRQAGRAPRPPAPGGRQRDRDRLPVQDGRPALDREAGRRPDRGDRQGRVRDGRHGEARRRRDRRRGQPGLRPLEEGGLPARRRRPFRVRRAAGLEDHAGAGRRRADDGRHAHEEYRKGLPAARGLLTGRALACTPGPPGPILISPTGETMANATILVVDDQPINVQLLKRKLEREKLEVLTANNGLEALEQVKARKPDLILLDLMMPDMDGMEVAQRLQTSSETRSIPIIFVSARSTKESKLEGLNVGAVDYITKPIDLDETVARVQTQLRFAAINRENLDLQRRLDESRRAATIGAVAQGIAHNLNNLLGVVIGYL